MYSRKHYFTVFILYLCLKTCDSAKINTPRVLLPWFEDFHVNFTFEIIEGGCYTWSLSRDDIIDLEPLYENSWEHCSRSARVSVSKTCISPGTVIILAEEVNSGEILRGDVDVDEVKSLEVMCTTWKLFLEEAPEAFQVVAYDDQGNKFSTLDGLTFTWTVENLGNSAGEDPLVMLVWWRDTDYEAPPSVLELEAQGKRSYSVLLYGQAMGDCRVTVCLKNICSDFTLQVVASVVLMPATAVIAPGDTLKYRVVRARAGRLTVQDISETLYYMKVPETGIALLEDSTSLVRGMDIGTTNIFLMSGVTEVASATLSVAEPHSIRVTIRPPELIIRGEAFIVHSLLLDSTGHPLTAGDEILIRLSVEGDANVDLFRSTENGTITDAVALNAGSFTVTARLHSIAGKTVNTKVEGQASAVAVEPLEIVPPETFIAWTDTIQELTLQHRGGGDEPVVWSEKDNDGGGISLASTGIATIRGLGDVDVQVQLKKYPHVRATGRVWSAPAELLQVSSSGHARVGRPHHLHVALTATHPTTGELYNFDICNCASFAVSLLEGPEPHNVTSAPWVQPVEGACCVLECIFISRGVATVRVARGRTGDTTRVAVRAAPTLLWPKNAAALVGATLPVLAEGESLEPVSNEPRIAELSSRSGPSPHRYPQVQLFSFKCHRKGDARVELISQSDDERESVRIDTACAPHVSRVRLELPDVHANCTGGPRLWLRPGHELSIRVTLLDAIGRELLDERGPRVTWEIEPHHSGIQYRATDRLFIETHPEYAPVPVPYKYYQLVIADEQAVGWSGVLKANIPEAVASIQAKVVAPLKLDLVQINLAWEGEILNNIATVSGGSGRYTVETAKGVVASVDNGKLSTVVPGPGSYELVVTDLCVHGEKQIVEVNIEEILSVEVSTARAVCVGGCVPITTLVKGVSRRYISSSRNPDYRTVGNVAVTNGTLCGVKEGTGRVRASLGGVWSSEVEVTVFPPLEIIPPRARLPPGARLQLQHRGGPPPHLASLNYIGLAPHGPAEVSSTGSVQGLSTGTARIKLVATDIADVEMASAESEVEVIPITGLRVRAATQTLLVGSPSPLWVEAAGLGASSLAALHPAPRLTWTIRDGTSARLYTTHADDLLERSVADGLSVRVVPLKPGVITIDVRVRNMGQAVETRTWDSTIEILAVSDIRTSVDGLPKPLRSGERLALAPGSVLRLKSLPRSSWSALSEGSFEVNPNGELRALKPGHGVIVAQHKDDRNNIYRETVLHVEVSTPHYCTAEPSGEHDETTVRLVMRSSIGRELLAPDANVTVLSSLVAHSRRAVHNALGNEIVIANLNSAGAFVSFAGTAGGVTVRDDVWVTGSDSKTDRIVAAGGWGVCLEGVGWRVPSGVRAAAGAGATLAVLTDDVTAHHVLRLDRPAIACTLQQIPVEKIEFKQGEWASSLVPLSIEASGLTSGPLLCTEEQRYALEGVQIQLPYTCRTKPPHTAEPVLDMINGQMGCKIVPASVITEASDVELCAEWGAYRTCTKTYLLPLIHTSASKVSLLHPPAVFTVEGHPLALKLVKVTPSPGLIVDTAHKDGEITVTVSNEASTCGTGWVEVKSRLTAQELRVEVERECDVSCGTLLGALFSLLRPYLSTLFTVAAVAAAYMFIQSKLQHKSQIRMPTEPVQTVLPPLNASPMSRRTRTWSRSPYAANGPASPVYGDASVLPDSSFSPTRNQSGFL
ncbi:uncharacterized protein LOC114251176 [Bombyx mandarina]|uniref:Uncharacterized protein LOC114251176 n=1 Tax=Bombyx mandarina TaxID=7092 RepID=A0A6J2KLX4_BOMMA|nr:uncharacterized protein LOC114251176 [Bombyx mandarina]